MTGMVILRLRPFFNGKSTCILSFFARTHHEGVTNKANKTSTRKSSFVSPKLSAGHVRFKVKLFSQLHPPVQISFNVTPLPPIVA